MKKLFIFICLFLIIIIYLVIDNTYAINEEEYSNIININLELKNNNNYELLKEEIYNYIDLIDNTLIPLVTTDNLNNNYEFMTNFAVNFILDNYDYYKSKIEILDNYTYTNDYNNTYNTNNYIDVSYIYDITYKLFNKRDYLITNEYFSIIDNKVSLIRLNDYNFKMEIDKILNINNEDNNLVVEVKYKNIDLIYKYIFIINEDKLILNELSI